MTQLAEHAAGDPDPDVEGRFRILLTRPDQAVFVAEDDAGQVVGLLSVGHHPTLWHSGPSALIDELVVTRVARERGIGRSLTAAAFEWARAAGCSEIGVSTELANAGARAFYRRVGFDEEALLLEYHFPRSVL
jgi:ribosomal protein S18 acetylase RimI-like enzyme